ncbi:rod-binding protein [Novosphingobium sp. B 225]|uniref:rod-binding protein n=1 Tax=Novosphingobium sp. B 225 TaxID=1961849 RepID=UPI000B4C1477|nr:rod-binding protein [Novosphingobium sp. B 225]
MTAVSSPMLAAGSLVSSHGSDREKLAGVAKQFEAMFVRQMLAAARKADFGEPLLGGQALETFRTMQDEHFADAAAQAGSFGLARMIEVQLARQAGLDAPASAAGRT